MLPIGDQAPNFPLHATGSSPADLAALLTRGPVILYFYPADFSRVCTAQACSLRDIHHDLADAGLTVIGVSPQDAASHAKFARENNLPFTLVSDPDKSIIRAYKATWPLGFGVRRVTYLIGSDGKITDRVSAEVSVDAHREFVERVIADLTARRSHPPPPRTPAPPSRTPPGTPP